MKTTLLVTLASDAPLDFVSKAIAGLPGVSRVETKEDSADMFGEPVKRKERPRNALFDALAKLDCPDLSQLTAPAAGRVAKALQAIRQVSPDVTKEEIEARAANYLLHMPNATLTSTALSAHWGRCQHAPIIVQKMVSTPHWKLCRDIEERIAKHPANPKWVGYVRGDATEEQEQDYRQLVKKLEELRFMP
jgi:hypothetical protein